MKRITIDLSKEIFIRFNFTILLFVLVFLYIYINFHLNETKLSTIQHIYTIMPTIVLDIYLLLHMSRVLSGPNSLLKLSDEMFR